jgi:hypothetical protein
MERVSVAISTACALLNVEKFYPDQEEALCNFFNFFMKSRSFPKLYMY